ncbi:MAG: replication-associated recombination protein A [Firmicutes bacterium]|nr:replication-associated recombination protein A [Bacillota bacterium]
MRPRVIADFIGQEHILGRGKVLREAIEKDAIPSFIIWGPPGCGKTTLSRIIKSTTKAHYVALAAVTSGVADVRQIVKEAEVRKQRLLQKTILFVDEIHRFNKSQQDAFLPHVEKGTITLIGATTENPFFEVNSPLLSRARVYRLEALTSENLKQIFERALTDQEKGMGSYNANLTDEAYEFLIEACGGDARIALDALETAVITTKPDEEGKITVTAEILLDSMQSGKNLYDKKGEQHYDTISAFIKSVRGSNPDAAVFWLAKMLYSGEDPRFVARRLIILAAEDIGLADPFSLTVANAAAQAVEFVGMPEARIALAEAAIYLACAPKSNTAYNAINSAYEEVKKGEQLPVPFHLRNAVTKGMKAMGYGKGYQYPHDYPGHFVRAQYLPDKLKDVKFYTPGEQGHELKMKERLKKWWSADKDEPPRNQK